MVAGRLLPRTATSLHFLPTPLTLRTPNHHYQFHHHRPSQRSIQTSSPYLLTPSPSTPMATSSSPSPPSNSTPPTSGITAASLKASLESKLGAQHVEIEDMSGGCGQAYAAIIVSAQFEQKTALARHRLVNAALKEEIKAIHAWTPKCFTPEQWGREREREGEGR